jgi:catechol 2,3-dioxygenase-like lactoylglutathione lyase family enzyme
MGYHHTAFAARDLAATHAFYTEAMGFELVKAVVAPTDDPASGWAKHVFYDTDGGKARAAGSGEHDNGQPGALIAFWELHDSRMADIDPAISTGLGLEAWVNHLAFAADDLDDIGSKRQRWLDAGHDVVEIDHGFCVSIYTMDPNGILVEWCTDTRPYTDADKAYALEVLRSTTPELENPPMPTFHRAVAHAPA